MIKEILTLLGMFIAGALFVYLKGKIFKNAKAQVIEKIKTNSSIGKVYSKDGKEPFIWDKFKKVFDLASGGEWGKSIKEIIDVRKLTIYGLIIGVIFAYGWYQGKQGTPVKIDLGYGKSAKIKIDGSYLHITKTGDVFVEDKEGNQIKQISVKDIPALKRKLRPIALQLVPIGIMGGGLGESGAGFEAGAGVSFLRYWQWRLDTFLTNRGLNLGTSYKITDNSGVGIAVGKGFKGDNRVSIYYSWRF